MIKNNFLNKFEEIIKDGTKKGVTSHFAITVALCNI